MLKADVVRVFGISLRTLNRYLQTRRVDPSLEPKLIPGRPATIGPHQYVALRAQLVAAPDATLEEHCQTWAETHGTRVSVATMSRAVRRVNWTRKKRR